MGNLIIICEFQHTGEAFLPAWAMSCSQLQRVRNTMDFLCFLNDPWVYVTSFAGFAVNMSNSAQGNSYLIQISDIYLWGLHGKMFFCELNGGYRMEKPAKFGITDQP